MVTHTFAAVSDCEDDNNDITTEIMLHLCHRNYCILLVLADGVQYGVDATAQLINVVRRWAGKVKVVDWVTLKWRLQIRWWMRRRWVANIACSIRATGLLLVLLLLRTGDIIPVASRSFRTPRKATWTKLYTFIVHQPSLMKQWFGLHTNEQHKSIVYNR